MAPYGWVGELASYQELLLLVALALVHAYASLMELPSSARLRA